MEIRGKTRYFTQEDTQAVFPLGGIGTGNISLNARGHLQDFELFNHPNKGFTPPYTFFALHTGRTDKAGSSVTKLLEAELQAPYAHSHGFNAWHYSGAPRFRSSRFSVQYPFARLELDDQDVPLSVSLEAFTPFIPLDSDRSGLPGIYFNWKIKNTDSRARTVSIALSASNLCGWTGTADIFGKANFEPGSTSIYREDEDGGFILMQNSRIPRNSSRYMEMAIAAEPENNQIVQAKPVWQEGQWWDGMQDFWNDFSDSGLLRPTEALSANEHSVHHSPFVISSIGLSQILGPGETAVFRFLYVWHRPYRVNGWLQKGIQAEADSGCGCESGCCESPGQEEQSGHPPIVGNYYAKWGNPETVARYMIHQREELTALSRLWTDTWYASDVPEPILDAVASNLTVIRSTTCFRTQDGRFYGWEGCFAQEGCCDGNCTHVWNYAQTLAYFFPELERSMRETEYHDELSEDGKMNFRAATRLNGAPHNFVPASDGQLGSLIRVCREWLISGDSSWLRSMWPGLKKSIHFAKNSWDLDDDGLLEAMQHNTYDIEFIGVSSLPNSIWLAALSAYEKISRALGYVEEGAWAREQIRLGSEKLESLCYNGQYYQQAVEDPNARKYQYGSGCLADQMLGACWAGLLNLSTGLDPDHVHSAARSIYRYNFPDQIRSVNNLQRGYAFNDERGLILASWPKGEKPRIPFVYSDEVWTGVEYSVAALLLLSGETEAGLEAIEAVRSRFDGRHRNPWDEPECGHHYARSLASFAPYLAYTGMVPNLPDGKISLKPKQPGRYFAICQAGWGYVDVPALNDGNSDAAASDLKATALYGSFDQLKFELKQGDSRI